MNGIRMLFVGLALVVGLAVAVGMATFTTTEPAAPGPEVFGAEIAEATGFPSVPLHDMVIPDFADGDVDLLLRSLDALLAENEDPETWGKDARLHFWRFQSRLRRGRLSEGQHDRIAAYLDGLIEAHPDDAEALELEKWMARNLAIGQVAPDIVGKDYDDVEFRLSDYRGQVTLVVFTGEWCGPCRTEYPYHRLLLELYEDKPFAILGINSDADLDVARQSKVDNRLPYRSWWDGHRGEPDNTKGPIATAWDVTGWPTLYILDGDGVIRFSGARHEDTLKAVSQLMREQDARAREAEAAALEGDVG
jgi:thiol-disulfide isomerase/thioredoxin